MEEYLSLDVDTRCLVNQIMFFEKSFQELSCVFELLSLLEALEVLNASKNKKKRKRKRDVDLLYHQLRKRITWTTLVKELGPNDFYIHHRVHLEVFNSIHQKIEKHIHTEHKFARKSCCRGTSWVDSRSRLSMTLKHLGGSKLHYIQPHVGPHFRV